VQPEPDPQLEPVIEETNDLANDVDELSEQFAQQAVLSETRHRELTERLESCQTSLQQYLTQQTNENPILTSLLNQLQEIRAELVTLKSLISDSRQSQAPPPETIEETPAAPVTENQTEEPAQDAPPPEPKRHRVIKL